MGTILPAPPITRRCPGDFPCRGIVAETNRNIRFTLEALQRDFPDVDVEAEINHIRDWQAKKNQPVRNWMRFLRTWLSNAVKARDALASTVVRPSPGAFGGRPHAETMPLVRPFSEADKSRSRELARRALDALRGNGTFSAEPA